MTTIFYKAYSSEELCDLSRDIDECFDEQFNDKVVNIPKDEYGFHKGRFVVTVHWEEN